MGLDAQAILGFSEGVLGYRFDQPKPTPPHHLEIWELCCSDHPQVAIAAPRGTAKSTSGTFTYALASVLAEEEAHILILSANEEMASSFINDIRVELQENDYLTSDKIFGIKRFIKERETEIICEKHSGFRFRIIAKGAEQRMRGLKWERKRPSLVLVDDVEDEELVASEDRRAKFRRWFYGAVKPILKDGGKIRMFGTIMHMDSLLMRFMPPAKSAYTVNTPLKTYTEDDPEKLKDIVPVNENDRPDRAWKSVLYRAHSPGFKYLLWKEMLSEKKLRSIRQDFAEQGMLDVYGQEYLNDPIDTTTAYFRKEDFLPMEDKDFETHKVYYASGDLAITKNKRSAYTALGVGGMDSDRNLFIVDIRRARMDSLEIADEIFSLQSRWNIDTFRLESENIQKSIGPFLYERMGSMYKGIYQEFVNINAENPTKDKESRAQTLRAMMRAGKVRFNKSAPWYPDLEEEMLHFPKWPTVDQVDMLAWLALLVSEMIEGPTSEEHEDDEYDAEFEEDRTELGASVVTGY